MKPPLTYDSLTRVTFGFVYANQIGRRVLCSLAVMLGALTLCIPIWVATTMATSALRTKLCQHANLKLKHNKRFIHNVLVCKTGAETPGRVQCGASWAHFVEAVAHVVTGVALRRLMHIMCP